MNRDDVRRYLERTSRDCLRQRLLDSRLELESRWSELLDLYTSFHKHKDLAREEGGAELRRLLEDVWASLTWEMRTKMRPATAAGTVIDTDAVATPVIVRRPELDIEVEVELPAAPDTQEYNPRLARLLVRLSYASEEDRVVVLGDVHQGLAKRDGSTSDRSSKLKYWRLLWQAVAGPLFKRLVEWLFPLAPLILWGALAAKLHQALTLLAW